MSSDLVARILKVRQGLVRETGFVIPDVRIRDSARLERHGYAIHVRDTVAAKGRLHPDRVLVVDVDERRFPWPGEFCRDPAFGLPACWVDRRLRDEVAARGYTVVTPVQALVTHFMEVVREHVGVLLGYAELQKLLEGLGKDHRALLNEVCPSRIPLVAIQRVLQNLLVEGVSVRDLGLIVEAAVEAVERTRDPDQLTEAVRRRLAWQICTALKGPDGMLAALVPSEAHERMLAEGLRPEGEGLRAVHKPGDVADFVAALEAALRAAQGRAGAGAGAPAGGAAGPAAAAGPVALVVAPVARRFVRQLLARASADPAVARMPVLATEEVHPKARLKILGRV